MAGMNTSLLVRGQLMSIKVIDSWFGGNKKARV